MATIGNSLSPYFTATTSDVFSANGTGTTFTLTRSISNLSDIEVLVNNIQQNPFNGAYSVNGNTLTFSEAPSSGANNVLINYRQAVIGSTIPTPNTVSSASLQSDLTLGGNTTSNGTLFTQALIPTANVTYDIGTSTLRYKDIYLSGSTIKLGDVSLSASGNTFTVANSTGGTLPSSMGNTTIAGTANVTGDMTIGGNLTVTGTMTYINTTDLNIGDAIISLNADLGSGIAPTEDAGININRGASTNAQFKWIESTDNWSLGNTTISGVLSANTATLTNALPLTSGGTGANSAPYAMANLMGYTTTATAAGTTTLDNTSSYYQIFTGTTTQTVVLPVTSTLQAGWTFHICNNSTGTLTVNSSGGNLVISVIAGVTVMVTCIGTTLTTAADWEAGFTDFSTLTGTGNVVLSTSPTLVGMTVTGSLNLTGSTTSGANFYTTQTSGVLTVGGTAGTANIVFGRSTATQTTYIQAGATTSGNTKNIEIGTSGLSGSNTNITLGSAVSGATSTTIINGNLGIGTTAPGTILDIFKNTGNDNTLTTIRISTVTSPGDQYSVRLAAAKTVGGVPYAQVMGPKDNNGWLAFTMGSSDTERMRIDSSGNLGIGTNSPNRKLYVQSDDSSTGGNVVAVRNANTAAGAFINFIGGGGNAPSIGAKNNDIVFTADGYSGTEWMRLNSSGNLGIGTGSPTNKLTISDGAAPYAAGTGDLIQLIRTPSNGNNTTSFVGISFGNASNGFKAGYGGTTDRFRFIDGGSVEVLSLVNGGNVGIGTTSPSEKLQVYGTAASGGTQGPRINLQYSGTSGNAESLINFVDFRGAVNAAIGNNLQDDGVGTAAAHLVFKTATGGTLYERMRINRTGTVIIGSLSSTANGSLHISNASAGSVYTGLYIQNTDNSSSGQGSQIVFRNSLGDTAIENAKYGYIKYSAIVNYGEQGQLEFGTNSGYGVAPITRLKIRNDGHTEVIGNLYTRAGGAYAAITDLGFAAPIQTTETGTGTNSGRHIPIIAGTSSSPSGYRQHTVFGSYRGALWGSATIYVGGNDNYPTRAFYFDYNGNFNADGTIYGATKSFKIPHPLPELEETHNLVHTSVESPQADLIYRGVVTLVDGTASVNIDTAAGMTNGTFEALCREVQCFTTNESDWTPVKGKVTGNILNITSQSNTATSEISWLVIGERKDKFMINTNSTDENGRVIVEPLKQEHELQSVTLENTTN